MRFANKFKKAVLALAVSASVVSCLREQAPETYYTFLDDNIASFLEKNKSDFSMFIEVLQRAELWGELQTYGTYTCFAPTNDAFNDFLEEKRIEKKRDRYTLDSLTFKECDTIARTHLLDRCYYTTDLVEGAFPSPNRLDRYLAFTCDSDSVSGRIYYMVNKTSRILERDDTVQNGVIQIVNSVIVPSTQMLPDLIKGDTAVSIFYSALIETRLCDSLVKYKDDTYPTPSYDSITTGVKYHTGNEYEYAIFPENRYFKYTMFVEPNSVMRAHGIKNLEDLKRYAKEVYDESYPLDAGLYDDEPTDRRNPLNRFVSYHMLEYYENYDQWNVTNEDLVNTNFIREEWDLEDFFETMMPHSFIRVCTPLNASPSGIYINRKGTPKQNEYRGVLMVAPSDMKYADGTPVIQDALNGMYYYIDDMLVYSKEVRNGALKTRIRYDCTTLSPDFVNSGGRNRPGTDQCTGMLDGYTKNWRFTKETLCSVRNRHQWFWSYEGDEVILQGIYDCTMHLPPVPYDGTYEIRIGYPVMASRGTIQAYFGSDPTDMSPTDIPTDMTISGPDPKIGWIKDSDLEDEMAIRLLDKAMRNRGYMKAPASYRPSGGDVFRDLNSMLRRILTTQYMYAEGDYYLRVRQLLDNDNAEMVYDYLELVPKDVYASDEGEDKW
ncbi:MAG: fasciclin domain-containing protein [Bacteroidaceae bacterium]|nr:fasciclin domain-containing protein [Bacteroidaceae bacterium]